jgi:hypothetical protein
MPIHQKKKRLRLLLIAAVAVGCSAASLSGTVTALLVTAPSTA